MLTMFRKYVALCILLITLGGAVGCSRSPLARKMRYMEAGRRFYNQKDYVRAILQFENAARVAPDDPEPEYRLGLAYFAQGDIGQAHAHFSRAVQINPKHAAAQLRLAELLSQTDDPELLQDALKRLRRLLDTSPSVGALNAIALTELKLGKMTDADQHLNEVLAKFPQSLSTYVILAQSKLLKRDLPGAEQALQTLINKAPQSADPLLALAMLYLSNNRLADGEALLHRALTIEPNNGRVLLQLGLLEYQTGRKPDAEVIFKRLSHSDDPALKPMYAIYLFKEGQRDAAVREFEQLVRSNPNNRDLRTKLIAAYWATERTGDVARIVNAALKDNPKDLDALLERGELYLANGEYTKAQADLDQVLYFRHDSAAVHYVLAKLHEARGAHLSYRQELAEAVKLNPDLLRPRLELAQALINDKGAQSALEILDEAPPAQKNTLEYLGERIWVLLALNDTEEAQRLIQAGLAVTRSPELLIQDTWVKIKEKNYAAARAAVDEALQKAPSDQRALEALAALYSVQKQPIALEQRLRDYAAKEPNVATVQEFVGNWFLSHNSYSQARVFFQAAKAADPNFHEADLALALMDISDGNLSAARPALRKLMTLRDKDPQIRLYAAALEATAQQYNQAIDQYRQVLAIDPNNIVALNNLAYLLATNANQPDEAMGFAEQAKELNPNSAEVEDTIGWVLYRKGLFSMALQHLESASQKSSDPAIRYHLGMAYLKAGKRSQGERVIEAALRTAPNLPEAQMARQAMMTNATH